MGQKGGEKWTAAVDSQPTLPKPDRLLVGISVKPALRVNTKRIGAPPPSGNPVSTSVDLLGHHDAVDDVDDAVVGHDVSRGDLGAIDHHTACRGDAEV